YFIIDTQPDDIGADPTIHRKTTASIMEEYPDATAYLKKALHEGRAVVEDKPYSDEWGTFLSAYAPIYNGRQEMVGIVGVDIDGSDFIERINSVWLAFGMSNVLALGISIAIYFQMLGRRKAEN